MIPTSEIYSIQPECQIYAHAAVVPDHDIIKLGPSEIPINIALSIALICFQFRLRIARDNTNPANLNLIRGFFYLAQRSILIQSQIWRSMCTKASNFLTIPGWRTDSRKLVIRFVLARAGDHHRDD